MPHHRSKFLRKDVASDASPIHPPPGLGGPRFAEKQKAEFFSIAEGDISNEEIMDKIIDLQNDVREQIGALRVEMRSLTVAICKFPFVDHVKSTCKLEVETIISPNALPIVTNDYSIVAEKLAPLCEAEDCDNGLEALDDVFSLLADSVLERTFDISLCARIIEIFPKQGMDSILPEGQSLLMSQLSTQRASDLTVSHVKAACRAIDTGGERGTMFELVAKDSITVGSILESASYGDHVYMRGFIGIHYATATPVVKIRDIDGSMVTVCDGSENPTLDRGGRIAFGRIERDHEVFCIIGHAWWLNGVVTSFEELHPDQA